MPTESHSVPDPPGGSDRSPAGGRVQYWVNIAVKLTIPIGAIAAAYLSVYFENRASVRALVNQREEAETSLKATMFGQLIGPIVGPLKDGQAPIDPVRYALLVRMLALNFNEDFEFGPLMQFADEELAASGKSPEDIKHASDELRSVAHRVVDRQIAKLWEDPAQICAPGARGGPSEVTIYVLNKGLSSGELDGLGLNANPTQNDSRVAYALDGPPIQPPGFLSPNCRDSLDVSFQKKPNQDDQTIEVTITHPSHFAGLPSIGAGEPQKYIFDLGPFAFPFSDNTPLADGNRFAVFENDVSSFHVGNEDVKIMRVRLRWFPEFYYPPTERPVNPRD